MAPESEHISDPGSGEYTTGAANVPGVPVFVGNATGQILFQFSVENNGANVLFAIYEKEESTGLGYLKLDGTVETQPDDTAVTTNWFTAAQWTSTITAKSLTAPKSYYFKVKAKNEDGVITDYSAYNTTPMVPYIDIDFSPDSNALILPITTGNVMISGLTVTAVGPASPGVYTIGFTLTRQNSPSTKGNVKIAYGTDGINYTDLTDGSISGSITNLTASLTGTANSNTWASCVTVGNSYYNTIYIRVTPYDTATAGDAGAPEVTTVAVDNRPLAVTVSEFSGFAWDKDATPEIIADMASIVCGDYLYFQVTVKDSTGSIILQKRSSDDVAGWYYEQNHAGAPGSSTRYPDTGWDTNWTAPTSYGVPKAYVYPNMAAGNRIRYIFQDALTQGQTYTITLKQAEVVAHNI